MKLEIRDPEILSVTEDAITLTFRVEDGAGVVDAPARVRISGEERAFVEGPAGTRHLRIGGLTPATRYRVELEVAGAEAPLPDRYFPEWVETLPAPEAEEVACFATLNDLHFGEPRVGGTLTEDYEYGDEAPGFPLVRADEGEVPYWHFMNEDAIDEINRERVDAVVIKGDIADRGRPEQFEAAARAFARFEAPHHVILGNHDHYARAEGQVVDGHALLGQPSTPRWLELGGWRLVLLDTTLPGEHHGVFPEERLAWLAECLRESREAEQPTLLFMHHQPVPAEHRDEYPNSIGILPEHSLPLYELLGRSPQVKGVLIGHTHRNRVRRHRLAGGVPFIEVHCSKDYPGGYAHYRLHADGSFRQEVRRTASERALAHSSFCRHLFRGFYRDFALGPLAARSFVAG